MSKICVSSPLPFIMSVLVTLAYYEELTLQLLRLLSLKQVLISFTKYEGNGKTTLKNRLDDGLFALICVVNMFKTITVHNIALVYITKKQNKKQCIRLFKIK